MARRKKGVGQLKRRGQRNQKESDIVQMLTILAIVATISFVIIIMLH